MKKFIEIVIALFTLVLISTPNITFSQKTIKLIGALEGKSAKYKGESAQLLKGNVKLQHGQTLLQCDSAYMGKGNNWFEGFGSVKIVKGTATLYGDQVYYDGNTSLGKVRGKEVKLVDKDVILVTKNLDFNSRTNSVKYVGGGDLTQKDNRLKSTRGYYYTEKKRYYFAGDVEMEGKDGRILTDSLEYNTDEDLVYFFGPTRIYNDNSFIYCEKGWYNRKIQQSSFTRNAYILSGSQKFYSQNIFNDKKNSYSRAIGEVAIIDTAQKISIYGEKANIWDKRKEAEVTENPLLIMETDQDSLFLRSETLILKNIADNSLPDSSYKLLKALGKVRFYRKDIQGICDSIFYNSKDSTLSMFVSPVIWNESNQITADFIKAYTKKNKIHRMDFDGSAFITSQESKLRFNQIKGKSMVATFTQGKLSKLDVKGNGQTVYFLRDQGELTAVNKAESSDLTVLVSDGKVSRITFKKKPITTLYPIEKADPSDITLKGFRWLDEYRPTSRESVIPKGLKLKRDKDRRNNKV